MENIIDLLDPDQNSTHRHDLLARVFKQKLTKLIDLIIKNHIYGETQCWMYSIEWQKRGLPHAHILIWLKQKILPTKIDDVISAELPNPIEDPILFETVRKHMIHGPCGGLNLNSPCMKDGKCTKCYPRELIHETQTGSDGYPLCRRRKPDEGGYVTTLKMRNAVVDIDNRWIVPYLPLLSKMFDVHINVEYCNSVKSIKYICNYVNKGSDMAVFGLANETDEIEQFQMGRYISSNEAVWRIFSFSIHDRFPNVQHLAVHLGNGQRIYFNETNAQAKAAQPPHTTLTAFFELCSTDDFAKTLLYPEVSKYYTWNTSKKKFMRRRNGVIVPKYPGVYSSHALRRVYTVHPNNAECYYLRLLLHTTKGPTSFNALKTINENECETYREACFRLGLLEGDQHWNTTLTEDIMRGHLTEASLTNYPKQIRTLFAIILTTCAPSNPKEL
ncbi:GSCOCG00011939001-RA-CDS [Cotesia congregata]|nr:GSCOCG00011939001-RA-CDS [Cotesia congregata]